MTDYENLAPTEPIPDQEALHNLRRQAAETLKLVGREVEEPGRLSLDDQPLKSFSYPLTPELVSKALHFDDQEAAVPEGCELIYVPESEQDGKTLQDELYMSVKKRIESVPGQIVEIVEQWLIYGELGQPTNHEYSVNYHRNGQPETLNNFTPSKTLPDTETTTKLIKGWIDQSRQMTIDDIEKIYRVIDMIRSSHNLTD